MQLLVRKFQVTKLKHFALQLEEVLKVKYIPQFIHTNSSQTTPYPYTKSVSLGKFSIFGK